MGHPPLYVTFSVRPSVRPSVARNILETVHHLIIIFGTHPYNDDISRCFFHFFEILMFWAVKAVKGQNMTKDNKENLSVAVDNLGTMYRMNVIYGTLV